MQDQSAHIAWRDGDLPVSTRFDDPYFSLQGGLAETAHVFLQGNDLPARFRDGFHIAELGFGTGLNLLATLHLWRETGQTGQLRFTTFEAYPMTAEDMRRAQSAFPSLARIAAPDPSEVGEHCSLVTGSEIIGAFMMSSREYSVWNCA